MDDDVILRVVEDGAIAREKDNDEKDECAIIIVVVVVVVVVAIFVLLFSLSFPCVFLLGEKKWRRRGEGISSKYKNISKGWGVQFPRHASFKKRSSVLLLLVSQKKKKRKGKERKIWLDSIDFFTKDRGAKILLRFPAFFSLSELYVDPQLIEYIPKSDARALRRKGRLERKQKRLRDLLLLLRRRRQNMKRKSWLRHTPTRATTIQQQQQKMSTFNSMA